METHDEDHEGAHEVQPDSQPPIEEVTVVLTAHRQSSAYLWLVTLE